MKGEVSKKALLVNFTEIQQSSQTYYFSLSCSLSLSLLIRAYEALLVQEDLQVQLEQLYVMDL